MNIINDIKNSIRLLCEDSLGVDRRMLSGLTVEQPRDRSHGDLSTNAAMILAKPLGQAPREIARQLVEAISALPQVADASIAGPGFLNVRLHREVWQSQVSAILQLGQKYGDSQVGGRTKTNIEYVSANPTGPMHVGHARGAVVGDALATLLIKAGYDVVREYYVNDAGAQIDKLARSAYHRYAEVCGREPGELAEGLYPGDYLVAVGQKLSEEYGPALLDLPEPDWLPTVRRASVDAMLVMIREDLAALGIRHDVFTSELSLHESGRIDAAIDRLERGGHLYIGTLEPPKGKLPDDWEAREQTLFRSSNFGDDSDRPVKKADGSYAYFAGDIGYTDDKLARGFTRLIMVLGADHGGYVARMKALVEVLGGGRATLEVMLCQLVKLYENGEPFKMSKRAGTFVTVRDVLDAVGPGALRFMMLTRKPEQPLDFDLSKVKEQTKDNPVFYVQYAHARCKSLLRIAAREIPDALPMSESPHPETLALLSGEAELSLIKRLAAWPQLVEAAAQAGEPHRVAFYLLDLAADFHGLWNLGNDAPDLRFVVAGATELTAARLALVRATAMVIASGLQVLGVEPAEEMR